MWKGRAVVPRFIRQEGHRKITAASVVSAYERAKHDRQVHELLRQWCCARDKDESVDLLRL
ncbi:hypothetical protein PAHAL_8G103100 [Panicum hallii]|uniref:Uncharacterized protein n=1 Tax=Panicum hallii TaxID=206008 RepID=A0A2T8I8B8_9POAL|nr:hypothetical protein PAHAL_8G103100 [Panicum hallii]